MINIRKENNWLVISSKNLLFWVDTDFWWADFQVFSLEQTQEKRKNNFIDCPWEYEFKNTSIIWYDSWNDSSSFLINFEKTNIVFIWWTEFDSDFFNEINEVDLIICKSLLDLKKLSETVKEIEAKTVILFWEKKEELGKYFINIEFVESLNIQDFENNKIYFLW